MRSTILLIRFTGYIHITFLHKDRLDAGGLCVCGKPVEKRFNFRFNFLYFVSTFCGIF